MIKIYSIFYFLLTIFLALVIRPIHFLLPKVDLIITERDGQARDNSMHLANYIANNHNNLIIKYVINKKNSKDLQNLHVPLDWLVNYRSIKHIYLFLISKKQVSTHLYSASPTPRVYPILRKLRLIDQKFIFLRHGIIKDNMDIYHSNNMVADLFICAAAKEYEYALNQFGYRENIIKYTGFPRFDSLHVEKANSNIIAFIPTWRKWLFFQGKLNSKKIRFIRKSEYYNKLNDFFNSDKLDEMLTKYNYKIEVLLHPQSNKFVNLFSFTKNTITLNESLESIQNLITTADALITDYSSVFFDFLYQKKNVIFYQFDYDRYRDSHYKEGYLNYHESSLGPVTNNLDDLINILESFISGEIDFRLDSEQFNDYFEIYDKDNSQRVFKEIQKL